MISKGSGVGGFGYNFVALIKYARVEIYIGKDRKEENEIAFDYLYERREEIEKIFGNKLEWERLNRARNIKYEKEFNMYEKEQWSDIIEFMTDSMIVLEKTFKTYLAELK